MSLTTYLSKRLIDLLEEKRVIVWYDSEHAFGEVAQSFAAPDSTVILAGDSRLRSRRQADEILSWLNDAAQPSQRKNGNILIYCPWPRGRNNEQRLQDPFESFVVIGDAFGDKEAETFQSLARQAVPDRANEIDRLFAEGRPTLQLIEGLGESARYPLLNEALGSDSLVEVSAQLLCRDEAPKKLNGVQGASNELLRLLHSGLGFVPPPRVTALEPTLEHFGRYVLFSEFAFDLPCSLPDPLTGVTRAEDKYRKAINSLCERMRTADDTRDGYIALASSVEKALRLQDFVGDRSDLGSRDTFPFEERAYLKALVSFANAGNLSEASRIVEQHEQSVWRYLPERTPLWKLAGRCIDFLVAVEAWSKEVLKEGATVRELIQAYTASSGFWQTDRQQRLVEQGDAACNEDGEVAELVQTCRDRYKEVVGAAQGVFLNAAEREGWPSEGILRQTQVFDRYVAPPLRDRRKVAYFLVDSLRYEMGRALGEILDSLGSVTIAAATTVLPTTTTCGMAALMPGADGAFALVEDGKDVVPAISGTKLRNSSDRMSMLQETYGDRFHDFPIGEVLSKSLKKLRGMIDKAELVVVRTQEIDELGEGASLYLARKLMTDIIGDISAATEKLIALGFEVFVYAADHGHLLLPEIAPGAVPQQPPGDWKIVKRRCLVGNSLTKTQGVSVFAASRLGITSSLGDEFAVPTGLNAFVAGQNYFHEGLSLQECVIPVVVLQPRGNHAVGKGAEEVEIRYRTDRFTNRVVGVKVWFNSLLSDSLTVRIDAYDGSGAKANLIGEAADCDARDPATQLVKLQKGKETQVPIRIHDDFSGSSAEIRATDPVAGTVFHRLKLKNSLME